MNYAWKILRKNYQKISNNRNHQVGINMNERKMKALKLRVIRLFASWKEPHEDRTYNESDIVQEIDISNDGIVNYTIAPKHPHCPCCLLDCVELKQKIETVKGVNGAVCTVIGIPGAEKWTRSING